MDVEKLIAELRSVSKHPESVLGQAANALAELQAENKKMRAENVRWKQVASEQKKQLDKLQATLEEAICCIKIVEKQRDAAIEDLENYMVQDTSSVDAPCKMCAKPSGIPCRYCRWPVV